MKRIDLGSGAIALEPSADADRVEALSQDFFARNQISDEAASLYESYRRRHEFKPNEGAPASASTGESRANGGLRGR
ncbi:MAG: hypothetical protein DI527_02660 [Chelatococcus sp.]|nr:MAG: hypothetical protein DI527_02660 [Chelatococcus sp.]